LTGATFSFSSAVSSGANYYTQKFDLRTTQSLSVRAFFSEKINQDVPAFSLGIRTPATTEFTGQCKYDKTLNYLSFDLYPISAATRALVSTIILKFDYDVLSVYDNEWVISIGEVVRQGALTPQTKYSYSFTLWTPYTAPVNGSSPYWGNQTFSTASGSPVVVENITISPVLKLWFAVVVTVVPTPVVKAVGELKFIFMYSLAIRLANGSVGNVVEINVVLDCLAFSFSNFLLSS